MCDRSYFLTSASTRFRVSQGGLGSRPAKNMLYSASSCFIWASRCCRSRSTALGSGTALSVDEEVQQRQPQFARVRHRPIVDQHFGVVRRTDDFEQVAELRGVSRPEPGAVAERGAAAGLAKFGRVARHLERARKVGDV